jgi:hypothetical protein
MTQEELAQQARLMQADNLDMVADACDSLILKLREIRDDARARKPLNRDLLRFVLERAGLVNRRGVEAEIRRLMAQGIENMTKE